MVAEQDILSFCDITGATTEVAEQFLEIADGNVETAVTLYLENGENTANASSLASQEVSASSSILNDFEEFNNDQLLADEELARQLQGSQQVRAPIAPKRDILTGDPAGMFSPSFAWPGSSEERRVAGRPSVFNQGDSTTGSIANIFDMSREEVHSPSSSATDSFTEPVGSSNASKAKRLADLFRPPFDIMFHGDFEQARIKAQENDKWLMINIQNPTEFSCQVLNRDLWSDSFVKEIIKESFTFLQYGSESPDGRRYSTFYSVKKYPHIAIIDSRTGERVKVWEKALNPTDFMMEVTEFLENHSAEEKASTKTMKRPKVMKSVSDMSEEEQLNAAIAASLSGGSSPEIEEQEPVETNEGGETVENKTESVFDSIQSIEREEPANGEGTTRIQIRMGDGSRVVRRFNKSDPVQHLFEFVKSKVENQHFELVFNRTQLIDVLNQSISEAGLSNAAVNCVLT